MSQRRILVTGATGGLGQALVHEALARGHRVRATGRSLGAGAKLAELGAEFVPLDLVTGTLEPLLEGVDSVIHAAALSASWGATADFTAINVTATERLLQAAQAAGVQRFVFVSSPSIFAELRDRPNIGEHDAPAARPLNIYARTKLEAERIVLAHQGMTCCAIRPRALVGPGDAVILPRLAALARRNRMPLPRGGRALIELTDLRDAASAICEAEHRAEALDGAAINISGGKPIAVRALAEALAKALGEHPRFVSLPLAVARPLAAMLEAFAPTDEPVLTRYTLATLAFTQTFDLEPARRLLGYVPCHDANQTLLDEACKLRASA